MRKRRKKLLLLIILMLVLMAAALMWIVSRGIENAWEERSGAICLTLTEFLNNDAEDIFDIDMDRVLTSVAAKHVYSHRGSAGANEHSFEAYDRAIEEGSEYIEQDLVISSDGVLFVSHDLDASRLTGRGVTYSSMSADSIDKLRTRTGNKILRLSEVFDRYGRSVNYVIELKTSSRDTVRAFEKIVKRYGFEDIIIVQSQNTEVLREIEKAYKDMPKLHVCKTQGEFNRDLDLPYIDIISVRASSGLIGENNCTAAHENGKLFSAWTLDSEQEIIRAINIGVDTYFTNNTGLAISLEKEYRLGEEKE